MCIINRNEKNLTYMTKFKILSTKKLIRANIDFSILQAMIFFLKSKSKGFKNQGNIYRMEKLYQNIRLIRNSDMFD